MSCTARRSSTRLQRRSQEQGPSVDRPRTRPPLRITAIKMSARISGGQMAGGEDIEPVLGAAESIIVKRSVGCGMSAIARRQSPPWVDDYEFPRVILATCSYVGRGRPRPGTGSSNQLQPYRRSRRIIPTGPCSSRKNNRWAGSRLIALGRGSPSPICRRRGSSQFRFIRKVGQVAIASHLCARNWPLQRAGKDWPAAHAPAPFVEGLRRNA